MKVVYSPGKLFKTLVRTFLARAIAATGALFLAVTIGRLYGAEGLGVFAVAQSFLLGAAILGKMGMDNTLIKYVGQTASIKGAKEYFNWAVKRSLIVCLIMAFLFYLFRWVLEGVFEIAHLAEVMTGVAIGVFPFTLSFLIAGFFKGAMRPALACFFENGVVSLVTALLLVLFFIFSETLTLAALGYSYALAAWLVAIVGLTIVYLSIFSQRGRHYSEAQNEDALASQAQLIATSNAFYVASLAGFLQVVMGVLVAAHILDERSLGLFKAAHQTAFLVSFVLIVINAVFPAIFSRLYNERNYESLSVHAKMSSSVGIAIALPIILCFLFFPEWVLSWYGPEFVEASVMLQIIVVAQFFNVATGSVGFLLNMTGHERLMRNISLICNVSGLAFFYIFTYFWGAKGTALATAYVLLSQNALALYFVKDRLGIWMLPSLKLMGSRA